MRITIHATIENADGSAAPQVIEIGEVTRDAGVDPASGLGLFVREANALLRQIQMVVLNEQAGEFIRVAAGCLAWGRRWASRIRSPWFIGRCTARRSCAARAFTDAAAHAALCLDTAPPSRLWRTR
ncbi:MAG: hypothetical protein JO090_16365 [Rhizobacter sp.]|nr:hypothetical protein [Rhizobacter sp.]